ncbi:MAG: hypothetical protein WAX77_13075 [Methylococcaceae bacterium]
MLESSYRDVFIIITFRGFWISASMPLDVPTLLKHYRFHYGKLRAFLEQQGQVIGGNDMLIAAHALAINAILITDNVAEFKRVPQLHIENWLLLNEN